MQTQNDETLSTDSHVGQEQRTHVQSGVAEVVSLTKQGDNPTSSPDDETEAYGTWSSQHTRGGNENPWPWEWNGSWFWLV